MLRDRVAGSRDPARVLGFVVEEQLHGTAAVTNPATGELLQEVPAADAAGGDGRRRARARAAQPAWGGAAVRRAGAHAPPARARALRDDPTFVDTLIAESGKPRYEAEGIELFYTLELTRYYTGRAGRRALADDLRHPFVFANKRARVVRHPRGVVAVIGPWNWPLLNNYADCIAPLVAGNAVVLKPSEHTPLTSLRVAELARDVGRARRRVPGGGGTRRRGRGADRGRRHDLLHRQRRRPASRWRRPPPSAWSRPCWSWAASRR